MCVGAHVRVFKYRQQWKINRCHLFTCLAASRINSFAVSVQIAGTVSTNLTSESVASGKRLLRVIIKWSLKYLIDRANILTAFNCLPLMSPSVVFMLKFWKYTVCIKVLSNHNWVYFIRYSGIRKQYINKVWRYPRAITSHITHKE